MSTWKIDDYECACGARFESITQPNGLRNTRNCRCGEIAHRIIGAPSVKTLETHLRGAEDSKITHGGYFDSNLRDLKTGKVPFITSVAQKNRILREKGLVEAGSLDCDRDRQRSRKNPIHF